MKEFVKKLIGRLEEETIALEDNYGDEVKCIPSEVVFEIVNQLAEEYEECFNLCSETCEVYDKEKHYCPKWCKVIRETVEELKEEYFKNAMIDEQYCWQTCGATEHCKECNRLGNGSIDYYENYDCLAEEYNNGWISADVELPTKNGWYWGYYVTSSYIGTDGLKHTECKYASIYWEDNLWLHDPRSFRTVDEVIAWKPIEPYQPKVEQ